MMVVMFLLFLLQVFQRLTKYERNDTCAGYHKQKVRHGSHLLPVKFRGGMVSSLPLYIGKFPTSLLNHRYHHLSICRLFRFLLTVIPAAFIWSKTLPGLAA